MPEVEDPYGLLPDDDGDVVVGKVVTVKGLRGEVKVLPGPNFWEGVLRGGGLRLRDGRTGVKRPVRVREYHPWKGLYVVRFEGTRGREAAETLVGRELMLDTGEPEVEAPERPAPYQVIGRRVRLGDGSVLGVITGVLRIEPHDVYEIQGEEKEYRIPAIPQVIRRFEPDEQDLWIEPLPGLLEI
jgi:16S rRNA processing protein RimM